MCIIGKSWLLLLQLSNATILQILRIKCKFLSKKPAEGRVLLFSVVANYYQFTKPITLCIPLPFYNRHWGGFYLLCFADFRLNRLFA